MKLKIKERLKDKLPGIDAHLIMSPKNNKIPLRKFKPKPDAKKSAVLILLSENQENKLQVLLTLRSENLSSHSSQISFPGGMSENNESPLETALRETYEEIGVEKDDIEHLGYLSHLYVPPSNFIIYPVVGWLKNDVEYNINPDEVAEVFNIIIDDIKTPTSIKFRKNIVQGMNLDVPYWDVHKKVPLWGATAMILSELIQILNEFD